MYKKTSKKRKARITFLRIFQISYKTTHAVYNSFIDPDIAKRKDFPFFVSSFQYIM